MSERPFAFGSRTWPGIAKLIEEAGEVGQVAGKLLMTGGEASHWDGSDLRARLTEEVADVVAACQFVARHNLLDLDAIDTRIAAKLALFERWHIEQADTPHV